MIYTGINYGIAVCLLSIEKKESLSSKNPSELSALGIDHSD